MSFLLEDGHDMYHDISYQPYILQIDIDRAKSLPRAGITSSDPYVIVRFGSSEVARTEVVKWSVNPVWNETYTIPLLHIQHPLVLEVWDWKKNGNDEILGNITFKLEEIGNNILLDDDFVLNQAGRKRVSGSLSCSLYLEKRKKLISVSPLSDSNNQHVNSNECNDKDVDDFNSFVKQEFQSLKILPSVQEAILMSKFIKKSDFDYSLFRDMLYDMQNLSSNGEYGDDMQAHTQLTLPMTLHRVDDIPDKNPINLCKSTRINISTGTVSSFICPYSKLGRHVFVMETSTEDVALVAQNQYVLWVWIRSVRRSFVSYMISRKKSDVSDEINVGDLFQKHHVLGINNDDDPDNYCGVLSVLVKGQLHKCNCQLNALNMVFSCCRADNGAEILSVPLHDLKSICVTLDSTLCDDLQLQFNLLSAKFVLSRATRESSFNDKSTLQQLKHGMTVVTSNETHIVVNFLDGKELITFPLRGISPFWDLSVAIGVSLGAFSDLNSDSADSPAALHMHVLSGSKGNEKVLGSKLLLYSELFDQDIVSKAISQNSQTKDLSDSKSSFIKFDMNIGLEVEILSGQDLIFPDNVSSSSNWSLFSENDSNSNNNFIDPRVEVCCVRHDDDPRSNSYKIFT